MTRKKMKRMETRTRMSTRTKMKMTRMEGTTETILKSTKRTTMSSTTSLVCAMAARQRAARCRAAELAAVARSNRRLGARRGAGRLEVRGADDGAAHVPRLFDFKESDERAALGRAFEAYRVRLPGLLAIASSASRIDR